MSAQPLVLVADDEPRITKLVSLALTAEGFRVVARRPAHRYRQSVACAARPDRVQSRRDPRFGRAGPSLGDSLSCRR
jgi:hypothetical protein